MNNDKERYARVNRLLGVALMAVSVLWILFCGACTVWGLSAAFGGTGSEEGFGQLFAFFGALSTAAGVGIFILGRSMWQRGRADAS